jgi:hypothetical protein
MTQNRIVMPYLVAIPVGHEPYAVEHHQLRNMHMEGSEWKSGICRFSNRLISDKGIPNLQDRIISSG